MRLSLLYILLSMIGLELIAQNAAHGAPEQDLDSIRQEPNLERRSDLAMEHANQALERARGAYKSTSLEQANLEQANAAIVEVGASVDVALDALENSGKDARRNPKFFKKAELSTREILRRIDGLRDAVDQQDRAIIEKVRDQVNSAHDELVEHMMGKKHGDKKAVEKGN